METKTVTIGTRQSQLALVQARHVQSLLKALHPHVEFTLKPMTTTGDHILNTPLSLIGTRALFTKELELALLDKSVDLVVHSAKDMPTQVVDGLGIGCILERHDPTDALVMKQGRTERALSELPPDAVIGTSSVRRAAQLKRLYPHLKFQDVRGNLNTRMSKLDQADGPYAALVLAVAGLERLGWQDRITRKLSPTESAYAVGQGALAIECRLDDADTLGLIQPLEHTPTRLALEAERGLLRALQGGCSVPIGVETTWTSDQLYLRGVVTSVDGSEQLQAHDTHTVATNEHARSLGMAVATQLLGLGAKAILDKIVRT